ncbi:MAG: hypothetical protein OXE96_07925 [Gemmatimonadetes bacterium]|nr:hypothetical protein [Gemmatimonadota bacterium]
MTLILRYGIPLLAVFSTACSPGDCLNGGEWFGVAESAPPPPVDGLWVGHEAPFGTDEDSPWWRFDVEPSGSHGTFATDRPLYQGRAFPDTLQGPFAGLICRSREEVDWRFELRYRTSSNRDSPGYRGYQCTLSGRWRYERIDGVIGCTIDEYTTFWSAVYLVREGGSLDGVQEP